MASPTPASHATSGGRNNKRPDHPSAWTAIRGGPVAESLIRTPVPMAPGQLACPDPSQAIPRFLLVELKRTNVAVRPTKAQF